MILEAAKSIAAATSALVKAASAAQRELIDDGKVRIFFIIYGYICVINNSIVQILSFNLWVIILIFLL